MGANFVFPPPIKGRNGENCARDAKVLKNLSSGPNTIDGLKITEDLKFSLIFFSPSNLDCMYSDGCFSLIPKALMWTKFFIPNSLHKLVNKNGKCEWICLNFCFLVSYKMPTRLITISELLKKLKITKQSLNRVLKDLIKIKIIDFKKWKKDTRLKHVYLNEKGIKLFNEVFDIQKKRIYNALLNSSSKEVINFNNVLNKIINEKI